MKPVERRMRAVLAAFTAALIVSWMLAIPTFAQANAEAGDVQIVDCSQVINVIASQGQYGDASAVASGIGNAAAAEIANELGITINQVNGCIGGVGTGGGGETTEETTSEETTTEETTTEETTTQEATQATTASSVTTATDVVAGTGTGDELADTGGPSAMLPMAGMLLIGAGLLSFGVLRHRS